MHLFIYYFYNTQIHIYIILACFALYDHFWIRFLSSNFFLYFIISIFLTPFLFTLPSHPIWWYLPKRSLDLGRCVLRRWCLPREMNLVRKIEMSRVELKKIINGGIRTADHRYGPSSWPPLYPLDHGDPHPFLKFFIMCTLCRSFFWKQIHVANFWLL